MGNRRLYVFRIDYHEGNEFVRNELAAGRLRQGWGASSLTLGGSSATDYVPEAFAEAILAAWPAVTIQEARARYRILYPMLIMKRGDLVVVPKFPQPDGRTFVIAEVAGAYHFEPTAHGDHGHCIPVDPRTMREFSYDEGLDAKRVSGKFTSYRSAINNVWNESFVRAAERLWEGPRTLGVSTSRSWSEDLQSSALARVSALLTGLPPRAIEELVAQAFVQAGYELDRRNQYDRAGGDADLVLSVRLPLLSDAQGMGLKLFVQVKKRTGIDLDAIHGLEQLVRIAADEPMALKVLFTTATDIGEAARQFAYEKNIIVIEGENATSLLARALLSSAA